MMTMYDEIPTAKPFRLPAVYDGKPIDTMQLQGLMNKVLAAQVQVLPHGMTFRRLTVKERFGMRKSPSRGKV